MRLFIPDGPSFFRKQETCVREEGGLLGIPERGLVREQPTPEPRAGGAALGPGGGDGSS